MAKPDFKKFIASLEARKIEERLVVLVMVVIFTGYGWLLLVSDPMGAEQDQVTRRINALNAQIVEEANRFVNIQQNYNADPNAFARNRQQELQQQTLEVDERLRALYGQLIQPRQMAEVLTTILQRETTLKLVSLENQPSAILTSASSGAATPLVGEAVIGADDGLDQNTGIQVYRHGLRMTFEGNYIETIRYLRSLENLDTSFFWQTLDYDVVAWPVARITLDIFTLSTQQEWIGV